MSPETNLGRCDTMGAAFCKARDGQGKACDDTFKALSAFAGALWRLLPAMHFSVEETWCILKINKKKWGRGTCT